MTKVPLDEFLCECVDRSPDHDGLALEELYGLYVSWCVLRETEPASDRAFRAGLGEAKINPVRRGRCPGLAMTGSASADYIVHRELPLVAL
ncbi:hypothetical protein V3C33_02135 [Micrococcaceae bacterium Sec5.7]